MSRRSLIALVAGGTALVVAGLIAVVLATSGSSEDELVVYSARSHYGEEEPFRAFARLAATDLRIFGGSASELFERIRSEGADTRADLLITVDAANLWRATEADLLEPVDSAALRRNVPAALRDRRGRWFGLTQRARTIMRSSERVGARAAAGYEDLGDRRWKGRLCLRSGTSEYNVSFVADRLAKDGAGETEAMLRGWMANDPEILGSDVDVLNAIADGDCDVGLANSYYLGRELAEDPDFPVAPVWADQDGRGTHVNLSGLGLVRGSAVREQGVELIEYLTRPAAQRVFAARGHEFPVSPAVEASAQIARFGDFKRDPIDVPRAGERLEAALLLMEEVGWD